MNSQEISLVKKTWKLLREVDPHLLGDVFYKRLFLKQPALRSLFRGSLEVQYEKFVAMLTYLVRELDHLDTIRDDVAAMAQRHRGYGVTAAHYKPVGDALLWTIEQGLGNAWNEEVCQAWQACYRMLEQAMQEHD